MTEIPGYEIITELSASPTSAIYRGYRQRDRQPVILKVLQKEHPTSEEIARHQHEYQILKNLDLEGVIRAYDLQKHQNSLVLVLEDFGGESLRNFWGDRKLEMKEFLLTSLQIVESLAQLHRQNIIHKNINPDNIVVNPQTGKLKLIDFGLAAQLNSHILKIENPHVLEGTVAYISPEQTGKINRFLDCRTDFYSLGVTLYEMLTQRLPFKTTNITELIHCHIAKSPLSPDQINPLIPQPVSDLVMKLLEKNIEDRYKSAWGIKADLVICLMQLEANDEIECLVPGEHDISDKFQISQKLYGRDREIEILLAAFNRVREGKSEMFLVTGNPGVGKSALVEKIYKPVKQKKGYFIRGRSDKLKANIPYLAIIQAFQNLILQLLAESESQIANWQKQLLAALGNNAQVIIDLIPELELLIGKQPVVAELAPTELQHRFYLVWKNFIQVFTKPEHPLVIFLDNLQWIDPASIHLIQALILADSKYLLFIGAYQDGEMNANLPLILALEKIKNYYFNSRKNSSRNINQIAISNLQILDISHLIADTLSCDFKRAKNLAELIIDRTKGNALFTNKLLTEIHTDKLLEFNFDSYVWQWNIETIKSSAIVNFNSAAELIVKKVNQLSESAQRTIKLAACLGKQFDLNTVLTIASRDDEEIAAELWQGIELGLIIRLGNSYTVNSLVKETADLPTETVGDRSDNQEIKPNYIYKFSHNLVQQTIYDLIPLTQKSGIHQQIGKLLWQKNPHDQLFEIVNQLNLSIELSTTSPDRHELARINLAAGKKAKNLVAREAAFKYLQTGVNLLSSDSWQQHYNLTLELYIEAAETASIKDDFEQMEELTNIALSKAQTLLEKVKIYEIRIQSYIQQHQKSTAIATALEVLNLLGIKLSQHPTNLDIFLGWLETKLALHNKQTDDLLNLPKMSAPNQLAAMRIMYSVCILADSTTNKLCLLLQLKMIVLSVKYGNTGISAFAYANYGVILCESWNKVELGYQFGKLALILLDDFHTKELKNRVFFVVNTRIKPWRQHFHKSLNFFLKAYRQEIKSLNFEAAVYAIFSYFYSAYYIGEELGYLEQEIAKYNETISKFEQETIIELNRLYQQVTLNLMDKGKYRWQLVGKGVNEQTMLLHYQETNNRVAIYHLYFNKLILSYLFEECDRALEAAISAKKYLDSVAGTIVFYGFFFYGSLAQLAGCDRGQNNYQKSAIAQVKLSQQKLKIWAEKSPINYLHKFYLVEAELSSILNQNAKAIDYYDRAIELAKEHKYIHEAALANELAAKFYLAKGNARLAQPYLLNARYCYYRWGAIAKVNQLEDKYPQLLESKFFQNK